MSKKILMVLTTGRLSFYNACEKLKENINESALKDEKIDLIVNYDALFTNKSEEEFKKVIIDPLSSNGQIIYAGSNFIDNLEWLGDSDKKKLKKISPSSGYGQKKNACLLYGMYFKYDMVLFWDDDEYPFYITSDDNITFWKTSDILFNHLNCDTQISFGFWTGYVSPIPDSFFTDVSMGVKKHLTQALKPITDVVFDETFFDRNATYYVSNVLDSNCKEITPEGGGKLISGGNLAFHIYDGKCKKVPAFYTPIDSRGDDSILSMGILDVTVYQVNSGIFHDAFGLFDVNDFDCQYESIKNKIKINDGKERFASVLRGWIAYAPTLSYFRYGDNFKKHISDSIKILQEIDDNIVAYFGRYWLWDKPSKLLEHYNIQVENELENYNLTQEIWGELKNEYY